MGWKDLGSYGNKIHETPNLDKLAERGMRFTNAYAACPICGPSRAAIMTGRYPSTSGFVDNFVSETKGRKPKELVIPVIQRVGVDVLTVQGFVPKIIFTNLCRLVAVFPEDACQGGNAFGQSAIKAALGVPTSLVPSRIPSCS